MKNKLFTMAAMVAMVATVLVGCGPQTAGIVAPITQTEVQETGDSSDFADAKQMAADFFAENFEGCIMNTLEYDDTYSDEEYAQIAASYGADEAVIFTSSFYVPQDCENMTLNPGMTYEDYTYTLTRSEGQDWIIQTCGMQ
ncbi:MAG: hypothetical protein IJ429_06060 [Lachnospiraceae bacterium]|nr:hypothetical protein [Lachnospiraceae bacterium]